MKKLKFAAAILMIAAVCCLTIVFSRAEASAPAVVVNTTGCLVKDANGTQTWDPACEVHYVYKLDEDGNLVFMNYQDKGRLPAGAPRPNRAVRSEQFVSCGGCIFEGIYEEVVTPSGNYSSRGPF